jgi:hypothetical protein
MGHTEIPPGALQSGMDYEFRFFRGPEFEAVHMTAVETDVQALERARAYLKHSPYFSHVEVRRGVSFMRRIESDAIPGEA